MADAILVVNAGSSSLKFSVYDADHDSTLPVLLKGQMEAIGTRPRLVVTDASKAVLVDRSFDRSVVKEFDDAASTIATWLATIGRRVRLVGVGHRVVLGGSEF